MVLQVRAAEEARSFWRTYDMDGSGTLDSHELLAMLVDLGFEDCTPERVEKEMRLMDTQVLFCSTAPINRRRCASWTRTRSVLYPGAMNRSRYVPRAAGSRGWVAFALEGRCQ